MAVKEKKEEVVNDIAEATMRRRTERRFVKWKMGTRKLGGTERTMQGEEEVVVVEHAKAG